MKILCVGLMVCDVLVKPVSGELFSKDHTMVDALELSVGGDAFNVASNLKALGVESRLVSAVGKDRIGRFVRETLEDMGLETDGIMDSEMPTAATVVMISANGERHFAAKRGASQYLHCDDVPDALLEACDLLYIGSACGIDGLDGEEMQRLVRRARQHGMQVALDVTGEPAPEHMQWLRPVLENTSYFLPSDYEAMTLSNQHSAVDAARVFQSCGVEHVIVKCGVDGAVYLDKKGRLEHFSAEHVDVVDTTGAGDAFVAGFLASLSRGYDVSDSIRIATRTGAACIQSVGASGKLRDLAYYEIG